MRLYPGLQRPAWVRRNWVSVGIFWGFLLLPPCIQAQGNYRFENYGNKSLLLNGAVTGTVDDLGMVYYNPARLAFVDTLGLTINAKAFEIRSYRLENTLGENEVLKSSNFRGLPGMVAKSFRIKKWPGHQFAYSFLSRARTEYNLNYRSGLIESDVFSEIPGLELYESRARFQYRFHEEWLGLSWAYGIKDNWSVGASLFVSLYSLRAGSALTFTAQGQTGGEVAYFEESLEFDQKSYGAYLLLSSAWKWKGLDMGFNAILPYLRVDGKAGLNADEILSVQGSDLPGAFNTATISGLENTRRTALQLSYGLGFDWGRNRLHFNADWHSAIRAYDRIRVNEEVRSEFSLQELRFREELRPVINFGLGGEFFINEKLKTIASFSSDFSAYEDSVDSFSLLNSLERNVSLASDFWHYGLGVQYTSDWGLLTLGSVYSRSRSDYPNELGLPDQQKEAIEIDVVSLKQNRWRLMLGIEVPL